MLSQHFGLKPLLITLATGFCLTAGAVTNPLWLRNPNISPDGNTIAFTYKGDIYTVPVAGGKAQQLTTIPAYDTTPFWSPDGTMIAFASDREGGKDIYVMPAAGGTARRITTHSSAETPLGWLDNNTIIFSSPLFTSATASLPGKWASVYTVDISGGRPHLYSPIPMQAVDVDAGGRLLYQDKKGVENVFRKHERSSGTNDIWLKDGDSFTKLTDFNGHDNNPVWIDSDKIAYISEQDGTLNVWMSDLTGTDRRQLTDFRDFPVRSLSRADNGLLAFSWNGELYTLQPGAEPVKINLEIISDDYDADIQKQILKSGATTMAVSPDGEEVAFVVRGDIYVTSVKYKTTKRITNTPAQEREVTFSADGRTLVYDSERDGNWQLFKATIKNPDEKHFTYATDIVETPLYKAASGKAAQRPQFSPDGKKIAFFEDRTELKVMDADGKNLHTALPAKYNYSYSDGDIGFEWSPDSRWLLTSYIGEGGWNNVDVAVVSEDGSQIVDLTESGFSDGIPHWSLDGSGVTYSTSRYGMKSQGSWGEQSDIMLMALSGDAWDKVNRSEEEADLEKKKEADSKEKADGKDEKKNKKDKKKDEKAKDESVKPLEFDFANRAYRQKRLTNVSGFMGDYWLNPEGSALYYTVMNADGEVNLMKRDLRKGETAIFAQGIDGFIVPDKKGENLFMLTDKGMVKIAVADGKKENIEFEAIYDRHPSLEREYIYNHAHQQVADKFYDINLHGVDWDMYGEAYARQLPYINNNYDFADLLSEILGELNASHTGASYRPYNAKLMYTADLGTFYDDSYTGDGLKVAEVLPRGPLAAKKVNVKPGDIILAIDGTDIKAGSDYYPLLEGKAGKKTLLSVRRADTGKTETIEVKPISSSYNMIYERWVERNEQIVDSVSGGKVAYVHVQGMDSPSYRTVYSKLLGKYRNRDAVVVDTRWNGGGWLHNDIAILLNGKEYVRYSPRGRYIGSDPFSQWTKPSVILVNESNYSDAHGTPYTYQTLKIGDIVGAPIPGTMTAVWWETQIDPSLVFGIPQVTSLDQNGNPLENHQLTPDVIIYNNPHDVTIGKDAQLEGAALHLLKKTTR